MLKTSSFLFRKTSGDEALPPALLAAGVGGLASLAGTAMSRYIDSKYPENKKKLEDTRSDYIKYPLLSAIASGGLTYMMNHR